MTDTLLIESNRSIAVNLLEADKRGAIPIESNKHTSNVSNSEWETTIDSGILLQPGDEISLESASINIKGAGEENQFQTFIGQTEGVLDNKTSIEICYYVNNNCQFNVNLPMGTASRNHSNGGYFTNCDYGSTCLNGKHLFGVNFTTLQDANADNVSQIYTNLTTPALQQARTSMNFYNHSSNGWLCNKGIFFNTELAMDVTTGVQNTSLIGYSQSPAGSDNNAKLNQCQAMGYKSWCDNTPQWGMAGVQFGQADPLSDSVNQNINNKDKGIFVRDQPTEAGVANTDAKQKPANLPQQFVQGGANPLQILPGGMWNDKMLINSRGFTSTAAEPRTKSLNLNAVQMCQNGVYQNSLSKIAYNTMPENFDDLQNIDHGGDVTTAQNPVFNDPIVLESCRFKGGLNTTAPNNLRFYCPQYDDEKFCNLGPYYDPYTNDCIPDNPFGFGYLNFRDNPNGERNTNYFHFLKTRIDIDIGQGSFTPTQIAKNITEQLKENTGTASQPREEISITPAIYDVYNNFSYFPVSTFTGGLGDIQSTIKADKSYETTMPNDGGIGTIKTELPTISNKTFKSYPTFSGFIWETIHKQLEQTTKQTIDIYNQADRATDKYWTCHEPEMLNWVSSRVPVSDPELQSDTQMGQFYSAHQAKNKFYKIMLSANPREWRSLCKMNPMVQSTPCTMDIVNYIDDYQLYSIYTGYAPELIGSNRNYAKVPRRVNNRTINNHTYQVGQYGCFSCLLEGGVFFFNNNQEIITNKTMAFMQDWYLGIKEVSQITPENTPDPTNPIQHFTINRGRTSRNAVYSRENTFAYYAPKRMSMIATNIIFDGNILADLWNNEYKELVKVNNKIYDSNASKFRNILPDEAEKNSVESQSDTFYDNNYVEWVFGRIDDQYSSPELPSNNIQGNMTYDLIQMYQGMGQAPVAGRTGTARFLPNIFLTYQMYNQKPYNNSLEVGDNVPADPTSITQSLVSRSVVVNSVNVNGSYLLTQETTGHTNPDYNDIGSILLANAGDQGFRCRETDYINFNNDNSTTTTGAGIPITNDDPAKIRAGKRNFGIPSWTTYASDFDTKFSSKIENNNMYNHPNIENNNPSRAYQKACKRFVKAFRYFPKIDNNGKNINYFTFEDALNERIPLPPNLSNRFTTRPSEWLRGVGDGRENLRKMWEKITAFNNGNGIGMFPIFYKNDPAVLNSLNKGGTPFADAVNVCSIPFMCLILQEQEQEDYFAVPETGEYISLGAGLSLSQNSLSFPATTQQTNLQTFPQTKIQDSMVKNGSTDLQNNYYQQNVGIQDCFGQTIPQPELIATDTYKNTKNNSGIVPSTDQNLTQFYASGGKSHSNTINIGANDPVVNYNSESARYSIENLHTLQKQGNGVFQLASFTPNSSPQNDVINVNNTISAFSQQVNLPAGYIFKGDDGGLFSNGVLAEDTDVWNCGSVYTNRTGGNNKGGTADRWNPGRCGGVGVDQKYIRVRQCQSIEGNVIKQTYSDLLADNTDIHLRPIVPDDPFDPPFFTSSIEPGAVCLNGYIDKTGIFSQPQAYSVVPFNFPALGKGDPSGNPFTLNCTHMTPYNMSQFELRCLNSETVLTGGTNNLVIVFDIQEAPLNFRFDTASVIFLLPPTIKPYAYIKQENIPFTASSSQSGIGITDLIIKQDDNTDLTLTALSYKNYKNTLFDKLGFQLNQLLPIYSKTQTPLVSTKYNKFLGVDKNAFDIYNNQLSPITTNGLISTSSVLALVSGFGTANSNLTRQNPNFDMPMYNLGIINASASTSQFSEAIYAVNSPQYQTYPYLVLYSNLIANCELQVVGGANGKQLIPALAFLSTSYSENNFIYVNRSDLIFKVTKQHTITSVKTSIHLPDGSQAKNILGDDSAVVYRIDFVGRDLDGFLDENDDNK